MSLYPVAMQRSPGLCMTQNAVSLLVSAIREIGASTRGGMLLLPSYARDSTRRARERTCHSSAYVISTANRYSVLRRLQGIDVCICPFELSVYTADAHSHKLPRVLV